MKENKCHIINRKTIWNGLQIFHRLIHEISWNIHKSFKKKNNNEIKNMKALWIYYAIYLKIHGKFMGKSSHEFDVLFIVIFVVCYSYYVKNIIMNFLLFFFHMIFLWSSSYEIFTFHRVNPMKNAYQKSMANKWK